MGGVEAAVLEVGGGLITNEGSGLDETEDTAMVVCGETWTRFGLALLLIFASRPALNTGTCSH